MTFCLHYFSPSGINTQMTHMKQPMRKPRASTKNACLGLLMCGQVTTLHMLLASQEMVCNMKLWLLYTKRTYKATCMWTNNGAGGKNVGADFLRHIACTVWRSICIMCVYVHVCIFMYVNLVAEVYSCPHGSKAQQPTQKQFTCLSHRGTYTSVEEQIFPTAAFCSHGTSIGRWGRCCCMFIVNRCYCQSQNNWRPLSWFQRFSSSKLVLRTVENW